MGFVLDASIALAWCFHDEQTLNTRKLLTRLENETAFTPGIWSFEVGNILVMAERRGRISYADIQQFLELLEQLNIQIEHETNYKIFHDIVPLAHSEKLTTYDATYLALAMRMGLPLASKDKQLCTSAKKLGVKVLAV